MDKTDRMTMMAELPVPKVLVFQGRRSANAPNITVFIFR